MCYKLPFDRNVLNSPFVSSVELQTERSHAGAHRACWLMSCSFVAKDLHLPALKMGKVWMGGGWGGFINCRCGLSRQHPPFFFLFHSTASLAVTLCHICDAENCLWAFPQKKKTQGVHFIMMTLTIHQFYSFISPNTFTQILCHLTIFFFFFFLVAK